MNERYLRKSNEDDIEYGLRLIEIKKTEKPEDLDWQDIVDLLGLNLNRDSLRKSQDTIFGGYAIAKYKDSKNIENNTPKTQLSEIREKVGELNIIKKQVQSEKSDLNKIKKDFIKSITIADELKQFMLDDGVKITIPEYCYEPINSDSENVMIIHITDWHIGAIINDCKGNYYNWQIANDRIDKLINECYKYIELYNIKKVYVINTGDVIEHTYMRQTQTQYCEFLQAEQINKAIKLIYRFLCALCKYCNVEYDEIPGNHDRMSGEKKVNLDGDNAEVIIREQLSTYKEISNNQRLTVVNRKHTDKEIIKTIKGKKIKFVHGDENNDRDSKKILKGMMSVDSDFYDILYKGHLHNFSIESENHGRYIVSTGCLSGYNDYSTRFYCTSVASQTITILNDVEVELIKDVKLQ